MNVEFGVQIGRLSVLRGHQTGVLQKYVVFVDVDGGILESQGAAVKEVTGQGARLNRQVILAVVVVVGEITHLKEDGVGDAVCLNGGSLDLVVPGIVGVVGHGVHVIRDQLSEIAMVNGGDVDLGIRHVTVLQLDTTLVPFRNVDNGTVHRAGGEDVYRIILGTLYDKLTLYDELSDIRAGIQLLAVIAPELDLGAGFYGNGDTLVDQRTARDDVVGIRFQHHVLHNAAGQLHALAYQGGEGIVVKVIDHGLFLAHVGFAGDGKGKGQGSVVGGLFIHREHEGARDAGDDTVGIVGESVGGGHEGTDVAIENGVRLPGHVGARGGIGGAHGGGQGNGGLLGLTPMVAEHDAETDGFSGVDDAVAVVLIGVGLIVENVEVVVAEVGLGHLGQGSVGVHGGGYGAPQAHGGVVDRTHDLTHQEAGGVVGLVVELGTEQSGHGADVGGSHGGTTPGGVAIVGERTEDTGAGGADLVLHGVAADAVGVGEAGDLAGLVLGHDTDDEIISGGIAGAVGGIRGVVTGGGDQHGRGVSDGKGLLHHGGAGVATETHVDDVGTHFHGVVDTLNDVAVVEEAVTGADGHDLYAVGKAYHTHLIGRGGDDTGHVGTVTHVIHGVAGGSPGFADGGDTVHVVNVAVAVVVHAVAGDLTGIDPHAVAQIVVLVVNAGINDGDDHVFKIFSPAVVV